MPVSLPWMDIHLHKMTSRDDLQDAEEKIEVFLTHLAVEQNLAGATQNQAMNALVFLYKHVIQKELGSIDAIRARKQNDFQWCLHKKR